jgi:hypothetical protein
MYYWFVKQPLGGERVSDIAASSTAEESHGSPAIKRKEGEKISNIS